MNPFTTVVTAACNLICKAIELRIEHYAVNPALREQDAANAAIWSEWGGKVLKALNRLFVELELPE